MLRCQHLLRTLIEPDNLSPILTPRKFRVSTELQPSIPYRTSYGTEDGQRRHLLLQIKRQTSTPIDRPIRFGKRNWNKTERCNSAVKLSKYCSLSVSRAHGKQWIISYPITQMRLFTKEESAQLSARTTVILVTMSTFASELHLRAHPPIATIWRNEPLLSRKTMWAPPQLRCSFFNVLSEISLFRMTVEIGFYSWRTSRTGNVTKE